jgi:hypothetical protein
MILPVRLINLNIQPMLIQDPEHKYIEIIGQGEIRAYRADPPDIP